MEICFVSTRIPVSVRLDILHSRSALRQDPRASLSSRTLVNVSRWIVLVSHSSLDADFDFVKMFQVLVL